MRPLGKPPPRAKSNVRQPLGKVSTMAPPALPSLVTLPLPKELLMSAMAASKAFCRLLAPEGEDSASATSAGASRFPLPASATTCACLLTSLRALSQEKVLKGPLHEVESAPSPQTTTGRAREGLACIPERCTASLLIFSSPTTPPNAFDKERGRKAISSGSLD
ncbi:hypothetical protein Mapa_007360 [Marchantia paleacea]|nr:hypothetical protein Mapa_007360 [Marchantia paleacea]